MELHLPWTVRERGDEADVLSIDPESDVQVIDADGNFVLVGNVEVARRVCAAMNAVPPRRWSVQRASAMGIVIPIDHVEADTVRVTESGALVFTSRGAVVKAIAAGEWRTLEVDTSLDVSAIAAMVGGE